MSNFIHKATVEAAVYGESEKLEEILANIDFAAKIKSQQKLDFEMNNLGDLLDEFDYEPLSEFFEFWGKKNEEIKKNV